MRVIISKNLKKYQSATMFRSIPETPLIAGLVSSKVFSIAANAATTKPIIIIHFFVKQQKIYAIMSCNIISKCRKITPSDKIVYKPYDPALNPHLFLLLNRFGVVKSKRYEVFVHKRHNSINIDNNSPFTCNIKD